MLIEKTITQQAGEPRRRWFAGAAMDLFLWLGQDGGVVQFQICYDKGPGEKAVTWTAGQGLRRHAVDDGTGGVLRMKSSPTLVPGGDVDLEPVCSLFEQQAGKLEHELYTFIMRHLQRG